MGDQDGGLDRIEVLWDRQKIFWFFFLLGSVAFNVALLLGMNWTILKYMVLGAESADLQEVEATAMSADIFEHIKDPWTREIVSTVAALVASFEVLWIFCYVLSVFRYVF